MESLTFHYQQLLVPDDSLQIDRSLDLSRFRAVTGFVPKFWDIINLLKHDFA